MRNFWKQESRKGLENSLSAAMTDERRYCHAFKRIPQVKTSIIQTAGPEHQAEIRLFTAANLPVDSMRFQAEEVSGGKRLRSAAAA